jgi:dihydroorotate dehydrogenase electron transfer subunit
VIEISEVIGIKNLTDSIFLLTVHSPQIASIIRPGQFCNIKVSESNIPLLRRPFSICDVEGANLSFMFDLHGEGTKILSSKRKSDKLDILGPLGNGFTFDSQYEKYILVGGGLGVAPFPFFVKKINANSDYDIFLGARSRNFIADYGLLNLHISTDDGSVGFKGTVIQLLEENISSFNNCKVKFIGCGPIPMLKALKSFCSKYNFDCDVSTESAMACGFGICQGCPVEKANPDGNYLLVCKDGPVFNINEIEL